MSRLRGAIHRYGQVAVMFLYTLLAPCSGSQCNYITLTFAGVLILVGIVFHRRWLTLLTLGALCLCLTASQRWLGPIPDPGCIILCAP